MVKCLVTMNERWVFVCLVLCIININADDDIGIDYYFGLSPLRSEAELNDDEGENTCNPYYMESCILDCPRGHTCFLKNCVCFDLDFGFGKAPNTRFEYGRSQPDDKNPPGFVDLTKKRVSKNPYYDYPKSALRHHIAHFCPNLDDARVCIRTCMPLGKPAFCGKDHACYCGHRYVNSPADEKADPKAVYAQFKDLYKKYFGDSYRPGLSTSEEND